MAMFSSETRGYKAACELVKQLQSAGIDANLRPAECPFTAIPTK